MVLQIKRGVEPASKALSNTAHGKVLPYHDWGGMTGLLEEYQFCGTSIPHNLDPVSTI